MEMASAHVSNVPMTALRCTVGGRERWSRPKERWRRTMEKEMTACSPTWDSITKAANQQQWRSLVKPNVSPEARRGLSE